MLVELYNRARTAHGIFVLVDGAHASREPWRGRARDAVLRRHLARVASFLRPLARRRGARCGPGFAHDAEREAGAVGFGVF